MWQKLLPDEIKYLPQKNQVNLELNIKQLSLVLSKATTAKFPKIT